MGEEFVMLSLPPMVIGALAAVACALPGNFLILRRQALIGDAISHVVLPGVVVGFLLSGGVSAWVMMLGAAGAAILAVALIEIIRRVGRIEPGAAMGVVFTTMFAGGVLMLEMSDVSTVHLDVEHALMGNLESLVWFDATGWGSLFDLQALAGAPPALLRLLIVTAAVAALMIAFWRPLAITTFDETYARALGLPTVAIGVGLVIAAAVAAVAAFDAVGSILVIAMFICPPAAARLMTDDLARQVWWSVGFAVLAATLGFVAAAYAPLWLGFENAVSAAGMIAAMSGVILALAAGYAPRRKRVGAASL